MEDCKRNSSLFLAQCIHNLEKEFEKAGLAKYSFDLRQKFESSLQETFNEIEMNKVSNASQEARVAAAISNQPTPCSPYYVPSSPSYAYSSYSPGNISCSPYYTPSSPVDNPYSPDESAGWSSSTPEEATSSNLSSKSKRQSESDLHRNTDSKKIKLDDAEYSPIVNEEVKEEDSAGENDGKGSDMSASSGNEGFEVEEGEIVKEDV